jgi:hypothetical protein
MKITFSEKFMICHDKIHLYFEKKSCKSLKNPSILIQTIFNSASSCFSIALSSLGLCARSFFSDVTLRFRNRCMA